MKDNFEHLLKEQLENYEMPYDNGAWEQFSKRLDGTPSTPFYRKWWFAASVGTVLVGSATYFTFSANEQPAKAAIPVETTVTQPETAQQTAGKQERTPVSVNAATAATGTAEKAAPAAYTWVNAPVSSGNGHPQTPVITHIVTDFTGFPVPAANNTVVSGTPQAAKFEAPSMICLNETFTVKNPNDAAITVTMPGGKTKTIAGKGSADIKATEAGKIILQSSGQAEVVIVNEATGSLMVKDESLVFENGIPTLKFTALNADHQVEWKSSVTEDATNVNSNKTEFTVHPYTATDIEVTAYSTDQNGCKVSEVVRVALDRPYNLMAHTGLNPSSADTRNNTFMPTALKYRDTPFELVVMDSKTMVPVYRTTDASQGWDGTDARTGQMAAPGSTWLWKVVLKKPQPGEPREYNGLVTIKGLD